MARHEERGGSGTCSTRGAGRDIAKERQWRIRLEAWARSGQGVRAFCRGEGLNEPRFYWWRRELARRRGEARGSRAAQREAGGVLARAATASSPGGATGGAVVAARRTLPHPFSVRGSAGKSPKSEDALVPAPPQAPGFVELRLARGAVQSAPATAQSAPTTCAQTAARTTIEVVLRGGRTLRVRPGCDGAFLRELAALLEEGPC